MKKEVLLTLIGTQFAEGEEETIELKTLGSFTKRGDNYFVTYKESEVTGYEGTTTTLKIEKNKVTMLRFGQVKTSLIMDPTSRNLCSYPTPVGLLALGVSSVEIDNHITDQGGHLQVKYALDYNESYLSDNQLNITIKEAGINS